MALVMTNFMVIILLGLISVAMLFGLAHQNFDLG
jgi:hypothetical protein